MRHVWPFCAGWPPMVYCSSIQAASEFELSTNACGSALARPASLVDVHAIRHLSPIRVWVDGLDALCVFMARVRIPEIAQQSESSEAVCSIGNVWTPFLGIVSEDCVADDEQDERNQSAAESKHRQHAAHFPGDLFLSGWLIPRHACMRVQSCHPPFLTLRAERFHAFDARHVGGTVDMSGNVTSACAQSPGSFLPSIPGSERRRADRSRPLRRVPRDRAGRAPERNSGLHGHSLSRCFTGRRGCVGATLKGRPPEPGSIPTFSGKAPRRKCGA